jgi:hypothetical protein
MRLAGLMASKAEQLVHGEAPSLRIIDDAL